MARQPKPVSTERQLATQFKAGAPSPNPKGRPPGSRNKLGEDFVAALQADFKAHGEEAIKTVREERPQDYLKVIASILPKQIELKETPFDGVDDETIAALLLAAKSALGVRGEGGEGAVH